MPPTPEGRAARLHAALAALPLRIDAVRVDAALAAARDYPGAGRPTATVTLAGAGVVGRGEHVGWTPEAHRAFAARAAEMPRGARTVADLAAGVAAWPAHDRAALEAAAIDLALRQADTTPAALLGMDPAPVRYVVSLAALPDPLPALAAEPAHVEWKVDVHPAWSAATWAALAASGRVAVLDWKGTGDGAEHARAHAWLPAALHEDPRPEGAASWPASLRDRLAADQPLTDPSALDALPVRPAAVNLKPARVGGVLAALALAAACTARDITVYLGGMWEVGPGRDQLRTLAALLAPECPNDIAPIALAGTPAPRPRRLAVPLDARGLG